MKSKETFFEQEGKLLLVQEGIFPGKQLCEEWNLASGCYIYLILL